MKKRPLTLIEVMIALGVASLLLAVMFPYLRETMRVKKNLEVEKTFVFSKAHVQQRLATLLSKTTPSDTFKTVQEKGEPFELCFTFDNGYDFEENFRNSVTGHLYLEKGKLFFKTVGKEEAERREVLLDGIKRIDFKFTSAKGGTFDVADEWKQDQLPLFFVMHVTFCDDKNDAFYFRLNSKSHLEYP